PRGRGSGGGQDPHLQHVAPRDRAHGSLLWVKALSGSHRSVTRAPTFRRSAASRLSRLTVKVSPPAARTTYRVASPTKTVSTMSPPTGGPVGPGAGPAPPSATIAMRSGGRSRTAASPITAPPGRTGSRSPEP